jgi:uncharacterized damage-inducible protein DinB
MSIIDALLAEMDQEAHATARVLERVPQAHLSWRPHPKSMSLGQLALHVATIPGMVAELAAMDTLPEPPAFVQAEAATAAELVPALTASMIMLNHWYHHRGQLLVYLRMHDVPLPAVYGRSADEDPFAAEAR